MEERLEGRFGLSLSQKFKDEVVGRFADYPGDQSQFPRQSAGHSELLLPIDETLTSEVGFVQSQ